MNELIAQADGSDKPHIICGDFNSTPDSPGYQLARYGYLSEENVKLLREIQYIEMPNGDVSIIRLSISHKNKISFRAISVQTSVNISFNNYCEMPVDR